MKKLYLHIGSYKTGTTSIQSLLHNNRTAIAQQGFCYPGNEVNHHKLYFATESPIEDWPRQFKGVKRKAFEQNIDQYFATLERYMASCFQQQIISTEYLFIAEREYVENILEYLKQFFDEIEVYVFIRNPVNYYKSFQQQMIKARSYITSPSSFRYKFKQVIEAWSQFCDVTVLEYNKSKDTSKVFCKKVGLNIYNLSFPQNKSNSSLAVEQMVLLEKLQQNIYSNKEDCFKPHLNILSQIKADFNHKPKLKENVGSLIMENHYEALLWLKEKFFIDFLDEEVEKPRNLPNEGGKSKCSVRDVYHVDEQSVELYEAAIINQLLKNIVGR